MKISSLNLKRKFVLSIVIIVFLLSLIQSLLFSYLDTQQFERQLKNKISVLAAVLADNSTPSLQFRNREDALAVLASLSNEPAVIEAYLFTNEGKVLAEYITKGYVLSIPLIDLTKTHFGESGDNIFLVRPIYVNDKLLGAIYVSAQLSELHERVAFRLRFSIWVLVGISLGAMLLAIWWTKFFIKPVIKLTELSRKIGNSQQYSLRADISSKDEIGELVDNFNAMLDAIQNRDVELRQKGEDLEAINLELEQFAYVISHDLKSPLVTVVGYIERLVDQMRQGNLEKAEKSAMRIRLAAERMGQLIEDVLAFSRIGRFNQDRDFVDLRSTMAIILSDLQQQITTTQANIRIDRLPKIYANKNELRQIMQNLILNALKYACVTPDKMIHVGYKETDDKYLVFVRDEGPGIDPQYHEMIFQLFQRLETDQEGTGLGLAIVYKAMNNLNGWVWVESQLGQGSTFWLAFPK